MREITTYWLSVCQPPPRLTCLEWADQFRFLSKESSAQAGKYRSAFAPYQRGPMNDANSNEVQSTCLMFASQTGKTEIINNLVGYFIIADPAPILMVQPTLDMAEGWSKERLAPMLRDCEVFNGKVKEARSRDSGNTLLHKTFPGGNIAICGANSPSGLAARPRRVVLLDEVDRYPFSAGTEGDPVSLAIRRTESFWNAVIFLTSTPTTKGASRIETEFNQTDQCRWFCPCPQCGTFATLKWSNVKWDAGKPETARYVCETCAMELNDADRVRMIRLGEWRATAPFNGKRGYHLNGIASPFPAKKGFKGRLHQMVAGFLEAKHGGVETLKTWTNTFLAETWEEEGETITIGESRCEDYAETVPHGTLLLVASADVQKDRIEAEIVGYGVDEESWGIERGIFIGNTEQPAVWSQLADFFSKTFDHPNGEKMGIAIGTVDAGYATKSALAFVRRMQPRNVYAVKGSSNRLRSPVVAPSRLSRSASLLVDTSEFKSIIYSRLKITDPGARFMHFPRGRGYDEEFFAQLTAEKVRKTFSLGHAKLVWENIRPNKRNEALDIRVYSLAGLHILRPNWAALSKRLAKVEEKAKIAETDTEHNHELPEPADRTERQPARFRPNPFARARGGWVNGWKG